MGILKITWHTTLDDRTCKKCPLLDGYEWTFDTDKDSFPDVLVHPNLGTVWDCQIDQSRMHGSNPFNCRCRPTWVMDDFDIKEAITRLKTRIQELESNLKEVNK
jgi:hypothetical protein